MMIMMIHGSTHITSHYITIHIRCLSLKAIPGLQRLRRLRRLRRLLAKSPKALKLALCIGRSCRANCTRSCFRRVELWTVSTVSQQCLNSVSMWHDINVIQKNKALPKTFPCLMLPQASFQRVCSLVGKLDCWKGNWPWIDYNWL